MRLSKNAAAVVRYAVTMMAPALAPPNLFFKSSLKHLAGSAPTIGLSRRGIIKLLTLLITLTPMVKIF